MNNAGINTLVQMFVQTYGFHLDVQLGVEIAESYNCVFNFMRNYQTSFHNGCTTLQPHQQYVRVQFFHIFLTLAIF